MKFKNIVKPQIFDRINQLTNDVLKTMLEVVDNVCGDQKLDIDHYWLKNTVYFIMRSKIEEINLSEDQFNERWIRYFVIYGCVIGINMLADTYNLKHKTRLFTPIKSIIVKYASVPYNYKTLTDLCLRNELIKGQSTASFTIYSNLIKGNQLTSNTHNILLDNLETSNFFNNLKLYSEYKINC